MPIFFDGARAEYYNRDFFPNNPNSREDSLNEIFHIVLATPPAQRSINQEIRITNRSAPGYEFYENIYQEERTKGTVLGIPADLYWEMQEDVMGEMNEHDKALWGLRVLSKNAQEALMLRSRPIIMQFPWSEFFYPELLPTRSDEDAWLDPITVANHAREKVLKRQEKLDQYEIPRIITTQDLEALIDPIKVRGGLYKIRVETFTDYWEKNVAPILLRQLGFYD